ncbi:MAG: hypothetical protein ACI4S2_11080 [Lachnospiraceae bacterium]
MKNKYMAMFLVTILSLVFLCGCSESNGTTEQIYGEVTEISNDSITVEIGTMKERERPEDGEKDFSENKEKPDDDQSENDQSKSNPSGDDQSEIDRPEKGQGKAPSMLELSGETKKISITKDTVIKRQSRGHAPGENGAKEEDSDKTGGEIEQTQEEAAFEDISEGDTLQITLDSSGKASEIIILSSGMRGGQREESPSEV